MVIGSSALALELDPDGLVMTACDAHFQPYLTVLILDDDPVFRKIADRHARKSNIRTILCTSFDDLEFQMSIIKPDVAILDYQIDIETTSVDHAYLLGNVPVLLTSRRSNWIPEQLPRNFRTFVPKKYGAEKIVREAIRLGQSKGNYFASF